MEETKKEEKPEEQLTDPQSAVPKALLEYQIEAKEAAIEQILFDLKQVLKKNKECNERNDLLKEEQQKCIKQVLREIEEKEQEEKEIVTRDDVEESLKEIWQYAKDKEQLLKDLQFQIEETEQKLAEKRRERDCLMEYKNVGSKIEANTVLNLEKDIREVGKDDRRITEHYSDVLKAKEEEYDRLFEKYTELCNEEALKMAVKHLDKNSLREIEENEWLKKEIKKYEKEVHELEASVQLLQEENISLVTKMMDAKLQKVPRHLLLTQPAGLQDAFPKGEVKEVEYKDCSVKADGRGSVRSTSVPCQKTKTFARIQSDIENEKLRDSDNELQGKTFTPNLDSLLHGEFQERLKLDPGLLCVVGRAMPIHKEPEEATRGSHGEGGFGGQSEGRITAQMIKALSERKIDLQ